MIINDIYKQNIIDHYNNPQNYGRLKGFTHKANLLNSSCGDEMTVYLKVTNNIIGNVKFEAHGCAISIASMSILSNYLVGKKISNINNIDIKFIKKILKIPISLTRTKCAMLGIDTINKAINNK